MAVNPAIRLLLISDIHCVGNVWPAFNRVTGDTRASEKALETLETVMDRYFDAADYVLIAGDLTDSGKQSQYRAVAAALGKYDAAKILAIPGNHDVANFNYLRSRKSKMKTFKRTFGAFLPPGPEPLAADDYFPYVKELDGNFALIGMDTTEGNTAKGRIGEWQLARLEAFLESDRFSAFHKIVMLHHDPLGKVKFYSGFDLPYGNILEDADNFNRILARHAERTGGGDVTAIFGHTHSHSHQVESVGGVNHIRVPSLGGIFGEDFVYVEISSGGSILRLESELAPGAGDIRTRKLQSMWKTLFPDRFS